MTDTPAQDGLEIFKILIRSIRQSQEGAKSSVTYKNRGTMTVSHEMLPVLESINRALRLLAAVEAGTHIILPAESTPEMDLAVNMDIVAPGVLYETWYYNLQKAAPDFFKEENK